MITSTLFQSITNLGEDGSLARDFADIFAWDVDFQRKVRPGDSYQILYERLYREVGGRETYVRPGRILAAQFQGQSRRVHGRVLRVARRAAAATTGPTDPRSRARS